MPAISRFCCGGHGASRLCLPYGPCDASMDLRPTAALQSLAMPLDPDKIDDAVLALLALTLHDVDRAWKGFDWDALTGCTPRG